eukprot:NODE_3706_length_349_cov_36.523333_g3624_i0.p1 GENE.NODE_3706_length_349_cov_36.523333_g3624_i0~~NODE_3706_length_349_cov_36.523333_g3624_i0.p1  ORF type:complete len:79 (-),score=8.10 NODE_3706_length_349_cov_36.523333_g3624_i0:38-274(-)
MGVCMLLGKAERRNKQTKERDTIKTLCFPVCRRLVLYFSFFHQGDTPSPAENFDHHLFSDATLPAFYPTLPQRLVRLF